MRIKLQKERFMEEQNLGISYTAFSRVETEDSWCLVEQIPEDRLLYINDHPKMALRHEEEERLNHLAENTLKNYCHLANKDAYLQLLRKFDHICNDGVLTSICQNPSASWPCILCKKQ